MQIGSAGKLDDIAERVLAETESQVVIVLMVGGPRGAGLSMATTHPKFQAAMPEFLRTIAADIERNSGMPSGVRVTPRGGSPGSSGTPESPR